MFTRLRPVLLILLAAFAYVANGAQSPVRFADGQTLVIPACAPGQPGREIVLGEGGGPVQDTAHACCGHCLGSSAPLLPAPAMVLVRVLVPAGRQAQVSEPLTGHLYWHAARPRGPPSSLA